MESGATYDALIIGGRAAGGSLALLLAQRGYRVLVVERDRFPSDTMSTHYMHATVVPLLEQLGVLTDLVEQLEFRRLTRSRIYLDDCVFEGPMDSSGFGFALAPRRDVLDSLLVQRATEHGADFAGRTRAERLIWEDGRVIGAELRDADGERRAVRAQVVIGADGKFSSVAKWVEAESYEAVPALRPIYYGHFHGIDPLPEPAVELFYGGDRIAFIFPMRRGEDCLALELQPDDFERFRADPKGNFRELFERHYGMRARMRNAELDGQLIGTKGIENYFRKPFGPGWVLTGDAGYLKDPSTGYGIGDALQQSFWLADALGDCFKGAAWDERMGAFQQLRDTTMMPMYQGTLNFTRMRDPDLRTIDLVRAAMSAPGITRSFVYSASQTMEHGLPAPVMARIQGIAHGFGARRQAAAGEPAPVD